MANQNKDVSVLEENSTASMNDSVTIESISIGSIQNDNSSINNYSIDITLVDSIIDDCISDNIISNDIGSNHKTLENQLELNDGISNVDNILVNTISDDIILEGSISYGKSADVRSANKTVSKDRVANSNILKNIHPKKLEKHEIILEKFFATSSIAGLVYLQRDESSQLTRQFWNCVIFICLVISTYWSIQTYIAWSDCPIKTLVSSEYLKNIKSSPF